MSDVVIFERYHSVTEVNAPFYPNAISVPQLSVIQWLTTADTVAEGSNINLVASLDNPVSGGTSVTWTVTGGTAIPADYNLTGSLSWADAEAGNKSINLSALIDEFLESSETVEITLSAPTNGAQLGANTLMTVTVSETAPANAILDPFDLSAITDPAGGTYITES